MMHITEDTPPDMLAGAMDLTVHLPSGRSVKMSVERSTPMMDLLVQITTTHHLQLSGYIIQALGMAPSAEHSDKILPYKPSTPIGALDTQHIKVIPKGRTLPISKNAPLGHQPFESTFRLKVHLPRNQLYVCRVSRNVLLEDIMKKVCDEKNLDPLKYEFRHPGNLDEVLNPKLTLNDYQITEIHVVLKGTVGLTQAFSSNDIMALRKEEERKQMQVKTGGGVFSLIFKRGKTSMGSGSLSSENRSISPTHSDDSRSVTPPAIQQQILPPTVQKTQPPEKPKPPQRKRRPAPKPPQQQEVRKSSTEKPPSQISTDSNTTDTTQPKKVENGLTICHSRNSSDSSGYHEASILSDNCNTTLPRRPKSTIINEVNENKLSGEHSRSTGNLSKFKSASSLALTGRKKKAAPPPPPVLKPANSVTNIAKPSPVVASQPVEEETIEHHVIEKQTIVKETSEPEIVEKPIESKPIESQPKFSSNSQMVEKKVVESEPMKATVTPKENEFKDAIPKPLVRSRVGIPLDNGPPVPKPRKRLTAPIPPISPNLNHDESTNVTSPLEGNISQSKETDTYDFDDNSVTSITNMECEEISSSNSNISTEPVTSVEMKLDDNEIIHDHKNENVKPPEIVAYIHKTPSSPTTPNYNKSKFDTLTRKRGFQIGSSLISSVDQNTQDESMMSLSSVESEFKRKKSTSEIMSLNSFPSSSDPYDDDDDEEMIKLDTKMFSGSVAKKSKKRRALLQELHGIYDFNADKLAMRRNQSSTSLHSIDSVPEFLNNGNMTKWKNTQDLDDISILSETIILREKWVVGDATDTESFSTALTAQTPRGSNASLQPPSYSPSPPPGSPKESPSNNAPFTDDIPKEYLIQKDNKFCDNSNEDVNDSGIDISTELKVEADLDMDWQYPLPSPPRAFRDSTPSSTTLNYDNRTPDDSVVTSPELFEKLKPTEDSHSEIASDLTSVNSEEEKPQSMCNKLTLEHLEKRKSLVYNRELATSLKYSDEKEDESITDKRTNVLNELENVIQNNTLPKNVNLSRHNSRAKDVAIQSAVDSNLPNFKITTYDNPKKKINIFEDDSVRSNAETAVKRNSFAEPRNSLDSSSEFKSLNPVPLNKTLFAGRSMENVSFRKHSIENQSGDAELFKKPQDISKYKSNGLRSTYFPITQMDLSNGITRSGSFSTDNNVNVWKPSNPVKRSKSQVALNRYKEENNAKENDEDNLSKSNSLYDLQSLGVIRRIQTKLNTPNNSTEKLDHQVNTEVKQEVEFKKPTPSVKPVINRGPPAINLGTWSDRPKTQVSLKEDTDYKINKNKDNVTSKLVVNTANTNGRSNTLEIKNNFDKPQSNYIRYDYPANLNTSNDRICIKVNGSEPISTTQKSGNLIIKIGSETSTQNGNVSFKKSLNIANKVEHKTRPHSIALDSNFDVSRVPVVRAVELKKPYKENNNNNRTITQINGNENGYSKKKDGCAVTFTTFGENKTAPNKFSDVYRSTETLSNCSSESDNNRNGKSEIYTSAETLIKPVTRVNSFAQSTPVVRGFRDSSTVTLNRRTWNPVNSYGTLPTKTTINNNKNKQEQSLTTNKNVPFSQSVLRRTESNKTLNNNSNTPIFGNVVLRNTSQNYNNSFRNSTGSFAQLRPNKAELEIAQPPPPPPPHMPKNSNFVKKIFDSSSNKDPRDKMLSEIRNFGGKKGLKSVKA